MTISLKKRDRGFALVTTLSLLILLTVIAVGLLTLSTVSLRSSGRAEAIARAQANARLALTLAIGELQKSVGRDQAITASADLLDAEAPLLTGSWDSSDWNPRDLTSDKFSSEKEKRFQGWLVSRPDIDDKAPPDSWKEIQGLRSVIMATDGKNGKPISKAPLVKVSSAPGEYAWIVFDENQKARINNRRNNKENTIATQWSHMGDPGRSAPEVVEPLKGFPVNDPVVDRLLTAATLPLLEPSLAVNLKDGMTTYSNSLMTNVVKGGLRKDLSLLSEQETLPPDLAGSRIYISDNGALANPRWSYLHEWLRSWRKISLTGGAPGLPLPVVPSGPGPNLPETAPNFLPEVAKIQIHFAAVAVKGWLGNNWSVRDAAENRTFNSDTFLVLRFAPVITLHNPYSVPVTVTRMTVVFEDLPVGFQVLVNGRPFSKGLVPFNYLNVAANDKGAAKQSFRAVIADTGSKGTGPQVLAPGEVAVFSPNLNPDAGLNTQFADIDKNDKNVVDEIACRRGWMGGGNGFYFWHLAPTGGYQNSPDHRRYFNGYQTRTIPLKPDDNVEIRYGIIPPADVPAGTIPIRVRYRTSSGADQIVRTHTLTYDSIGELETAMGISPGKVHSTPRPYQVGSELTETASTPLKNFSRIINLCVLSLRQRNAAFDPSGDFGSRFPSRPWLSGNALTSASKINVSNPDYQSAPYEIAFHKLNSAGNDSGLPGSIERDALGRGFHITGHQASDGSSFGTTFDFPTLPAQSMADLAHANLASSGVPPNVPYAVASSDATPVLATSVFRATGTSGINLDHSYLANEALWDDWYLSGITSQDAGAFKQGAPRSLRAVIDEFLSGKPGFSERFTTHSPLGLDLSTAADKLVSKEGYLKASSYQRLSGGFNINSTSADAWAAMLGSLNGVEAPLLDSLTQKYGLTKLQWSTSRYHLSNAPPLDPENVGEESIVARRKRHQASRALEEGQVRILAQEIVKEVRHRGPFLSLAEFVNRRLGTPSDETQRGAIQQAINNTNINDAAKVDGVELSKATVANPIALAGNSAYGSPAFVMQQDVLRALGPAIHVRGDTFVIRAYGNARGKNGDILAQVWCEAVVERIPDFIDPVDSPDTSISDLKSAANRVWGRRFVLTGFRYLPPNPTS